MDNFIGVYNNDNYYIDRSVLLENTPLIKLHPGPEWHIFHILTSEDIDDVISCSFTAVRCKNGER